MENVGANIVVNGGLPPTKLDADLETVNSKANTLLSRVASKSFSKDDYQALGTLKHDLNKLNATPEANLTPAQTAKLQIINSAFIRIKGQFGTTPQLPTGIDMQIKGVKDRSGAIERALNAGVKEKTFSEQQESTIRGVFSSNAQVLTHTRSPNDVESLANEAIFKLANVDEKKHMQHYFLQSLLQFPLENLKLY